MQKPPAPQAHLVTAGLAFGESPRWHDGRLWVCNWGTGEIIAVDAEGNREVVLTVPAVLPYSIDWLPDGRLLVVSGREGLLLRQEADGSLVTHADLRGLSKSPWNEIVVDGRGNIYVNGGGPAPAPGEHFGPGTIVLVTPQGSVRQVAEDIAFANGMAVSPDNKTLIIAESHASRLTAFDIAAEGTLSNRRVWADLDGYPDGICLDAEGAAWYADVPNKHCVRVREGGEVLQTVTVDRGCFACMLGGTDRKTLFILAAEWRGFEHMVSDARTGQVFSVEAPAPGIGWP
ncbi:MAG: SMP-30/gluconolactonase/LRE family protein [Mesorhizobium sp.]|uniref:SMP-30/gluconolactonase/LRE family protein n=1 Tax=Mesorhizobium sp. TaxID=1871066 RepID=UPI000FE5C91D|nr:SMP-30/gluconolactonase/LRE family protein [Mesorhizobium sp.]RWB08633.1 MAG: SMP-30/gluconolactonase/LRE family protein [Mesorhizobium sp.]RWB10323.1 MAG: SMP-30/gluconolactonase/LRE family protein [Mesorhizobium sp.]RWO65193.1 MAG: SMP-30/gluconolactonase/LRE family protein [Mesorhizobium sp.]